MSALIEIEAVTLRYGALQVVHGVSLAVARGEFFALLGPSGSGKTTLLRAIAGFERPAAGRIRIEGQDVTGLRPARRPVNMMFQSYALFPHMSVAANVAYGLEMERRPRSEIAERVGATLATLGLGPLADRRPDQLSGGQRQRAALARALVKRPKALLLDEPLSALDRGLRDEMRGELKRLQHELGIAFVMVTHDQEEALGLADRLAVMRAGRIAATGAPRALYDRPPDRFTAAFLGATNLIEGRAGPDGFEAPGFGRLPAAGVPSGPAALAIRPERVRVTAGAQPPPPAARATVAEAVFSGADLTLKLAVPGAARPLSARLPAADPAAARLAPGALVWCSWAPGDARLLTDPPEPAVSPEPKDAR